MVGCELIRPLFFTNHILGRISIWHILLLHGGVGRLHAYATVVASDLSNPPNQVQPPVTNNFILTIIVSLVSSGTLWGGLQFWLGRKNAAAEAARTKAAEEFDTENAKKLRRDNDAAVEEAKRKMQIDIFNANDKRYKELATDYHKQGEKLDGLQNIAEALLGSFDTLLYGAVIDESSGTMVIKVTQQDILDLRLNMRKARLLLY
jgi:hypothetical protein